MNAEENKLVKDLLTGHSQLTYVKMNYSMKFAMRFTSRKEDVKFYNVLFKYLTQKSVTPWRRKIYKFKFPLSGESFIIMEIHFHYERLCDVADNRYESYKKLIGVK